MVQTNWGGEFRSLHKFFNTLGIHHRITCPHTHQQNGSVERRHRHIVETGLALLSHASVPYKYWDSAFQMACYLINRLPTPILSNISPLEKLFQQQPNYSFLRVFGCECWPYLRPYNRHKMEFHSQRCIFLGYSSNHRGYKCLDLKSGRVFLSRHVIFNESNFPFKETIHEPIIVPDPPIPLPPTLQVSNSSSYVSQPVETSSPTPPDPPSPPSHVSSAPSLPALSPTSSVPESIQPAAVVNPPLRSHLMQTRLQNNIQNPYSIMMVMCVILFRKR